MFMQQPLQAHIKMKAAFAMRTGHQVLLHNRDFIDAQLVIYIEMKTSYCFKTIHTFFHKPSATPGAWYCLQGDRRAIQHDSHPGNIAVEIISVHSNIIGKYFHSRANYAILHW